VAQSSDVETSFSGETHERSLNKASALRAPWWERCAQLRRGGDRGIPERCRAVDERERATGGAEPLVEQLPHGREFAREHVLRRVRRDVQEIEIFDAWALEFQARERASVPCGERGRDRCHARRANRRGDVARVRWVFHEGVCAQQ